jgi:hypothetical protein
MFDRQRRRKRILRQFLRRPSNAFLIALCIALTIALLSVSLSPQSPFNQRPNINAEQNSSESVESQRNSNNLTAPVNTASQDNRNNGSDQASEFWTIFGHRLKITDTLLVLFTFTLWWATLGLVSGADETAERDLRAYVLLEDTFFIYAGEAPRIDSPDREFTDVHKLRIKNFGQTPAFDMSVWLRRSPTEIPIKNIDGLLLKSHSEQPLAPGHRYGPNFPVEKKFLHTDSFFVYGKFIYRDIYDRWWVTRFGWQYLPGVRFTPYGLHNREDGPFSVKPG